MAADEAPGVVLAIENGSGTGFGLGTSIQQLAAIDDTLAARGIDPGRTGFCLDTAHLWGAGYALDTADAVDATLAAFDAGLGLARVRLVHLNDSRSELGSHSDRHEHIGAGRIGGRGLARVLTHPGLAHVTYLLETPGMDDGYDAVNLRRAFLLWQGATELPILPPKAFRTSRKSTRTGVRTGGSGSA